MCSVCVVCIARCSVLYVCVYRCIGVCVCIGASVFVCIGASVFVCIGASVFVCSSGLLFCVQSGMVVSVYACVCETGLLESVYWTFSFGVCVIFWGCRCRCRGCGCLSVFVVACFPDRGRYASRGRFYVVWYRICVRVRGVRGVRCEV